jgi:hypothetical protein
MANYGINFDFIILIIVIFELLLGAIRGLYNQAQKTIALLVPIILNYFLFPLVINILFSLKGYMAFSRVAVTIIGLKGHANLAITIGNYILLYLVFYFLIIYFFKTIRRRNLLFFLGDKKPASRALGSALSLGSSYILIFILGYLLSPIVNVNHKSPVSNVIVTQSNHLFEVSKLNEYQNLNIDDYLEIKETRKQFSFGFIDDDFETYQRLVDLNITFEETSWNEVLMKDEAKMLLLGEKDLFAFTTKKGKKYVIDQIIKLEKGNPNIEILKENRDFIIKYQAYFPVVLGNDLHNRENIMDLIIASKDDIYANSNRYGKMALEKSIEKYQFYFDHKNKLFFMLGVNSLEEYQNKLIAIENNRELLNQYNEKFLVVFATENSYYFKNAKTIIKQYQAHEEEFLLLNDEIDFASRLIFASNYEELFVKRTWEKRPLLKAYMNDALLNKKIHGHDIYSQYIFYLYTNTYQDDVVLTEAGIDLFFINLDNINFKSPIAIYENIFFQERFKKDGLLNDDLINYSGVKAYG